MCRVRISQARYDEHESETMSIKQAEARFSRDPFAKFLGMQLVDIAHERAIVTLPYQPEHANAIGPLNGGASASLLNVAGKIAAWTGIDFDQDPYLACVNMTIQYLSAAIEKVSKKGGVGGPVALASGYENTYPLPNRPE